MTVQHKISLDAVTAQTETKSRAYSLLASTGFSLASRRRLSAPLSSLSSQSRAWGDTAQRIAAVPAVAEIIESALGESIKRARRALSEHPPCEEIVDPEACACPQCGGALRNIGADVTEILERGSIRSHVTNLRRERHSYDQIDTAQHLERSDNGGQRPCRQTLRSPLRAAPRAPYRSVRLPPSPVARSDGRDDRSMLLQTW
jgi:hypothetical protein